MRRTATWLWRLTILLAFTASIASNVLTLTSAAFNTAISGALSAALGVQTVTGALNQRIAQQNKQMLQRKAVARKFGTRLASRTRRVAAASIATLPAEALPLIGISVLIAGTAYELYAACESMRDLNALYTGLGMEEEVPADVLRSVCEVKMPEW
jgi:hypothetical protein